MHRDEPPGVEYLVTVMAIAAIALSTFILVLALAYKLSLEWF